MIGKQLQLESDLDKYQKKLNELYRDRKEIVESIKELSRRQRFMSDRDGKDHRLNKLPSTLVKQPSLQGQRLTHRIGGEEAPKSQQSISEHPHLDTNQKEIKQVVEVQSAIKDRNRRLFGGLNTHLKKAESKLSEESSKVRSKQSIEERVSQKQREQSQLFQQQKRKEIQQSLQRLTSAKESNSKEMLMTENVILKNKFIAYVSDLQHYLYTQTLPSIAWKPKTPNETIQKYHDQNNERLKAFAVEKVRQIEEYNEKFDFNKYRVENEKEYYTNYLDNYFKSKLQFISTTYLCDYFRTKPSVYWKPNSHNKNTRLALEKCQKTSEEEKHAISQQNQAYYKRFEKEAIAAVDQHSQESESEH